MKEKNFTKEMSYLLFLYSFGTFVFRISGNYFERALAVYPPSVENMSFTSLDSLGHQVLC